MAQAPQPGLEVLREVRIGPCCRGDRATAVAAGRGELPTDGPPCCGGEALPGGGHWCSACGAACWPILGMILCAWALAPATPSAALRVCAAGQEIMALLRGETCSRVPAAARAGELRLDAEPFVPRCGGVPEVEAAPGDWREPRRPAKARPASVWRGLRRCAETFAALGGAGEDSDDGEDDDPLVPEG